jgi:hypothetical protein
LLVNNDPSAATTQTVNNMPLNQWLSQFDLFRPQEQSVANTPAEIKETQKALDQLFTLTKQYEWSGAYLDLLRFIGRFRFYSPYNAMLVHVQMPGATFVASASRWLTKYSRRIRTGAHPIVILQPKGPVMFVFDVSDTEAEGDAPLLPRDVPIHLRSEEAASVPNSKRRSKRRSATASGFFRRAQVLKVPAQSGVSGRARFRML